ncbi:MAG: HIT family protein [Thermoproteota archaeon]
MTKMKDCIFCRIVGGSASASVVYSDKEVMAIMDIKPVNLGHILVIPKAHAARLSALNEGIGGHMFRLAMRIVDALKNSSVKCEGANLCLSDGEVAGQEVSHVHLHVIPRYRGDGLKMSAVSRPGQEPKREILEETAEDIRRWLRN